jgi:hypothetical protein
MQSKAAALILVMLLAGCGSSPKTHFYTLGPVAPGSHAIPVAATGAPVQVGHVALPATLDRLSLVTHGPGDQVIVSDHDQWAAPLDELVQRALTADLRARLGPDHVLAPGDPPPPQGVRGLLLHVQRFAADANGQVLLDVDWDVEHGGKRSTPHHEEIRVDGSGQGGEAIARAMSQAVAVLADRVAAAL